MSHSTAHSEAFVVPALNTFPSAHVWTLPRTCLMGICSTALPVDNPQNKLFHFLKQFPISFWAPRAQKAQTVLRIHNSGTKRGGHEFVVDGLRGDRRGRPCWFYFLVSCFRLTGFWRCTFEPVTLCQWSANDLPVFLIDGNNSSLDSVEILESQTCSETLNQIIIHYSINIK